MSQTFKVVVTDQVFPSIDTETELLAAIGARIEVADGTPAGVARLGADAAGPARPARPVSTRPPRAVLISTAVGFIMASSAAPIRPLVCAVSGACSDTASHRPSRSGRASSVGAEPGDARGGAVGDLDPGADRG